MSSAVTELLQKWTQGDQEIANQLLPLVYEDLRRRARNYLKHERKGHTLQATALVHEAYFRFANQVPQSLNNREHFLALAAKIMRQILVDHARNKHAAKRGGPHAVFVQLDEARDVGDPAAVSVLDLNGALERLAGLDPRQAEIIELRFFGGLSLEETASVLSVSTATVNKETRKARAWLYRELFGASP